MTDRIQLIISNGLYQAIKNNNSNKHQSVNKSVLDSITSKA